MPRFYFHFRDRNGVAIDNEGQELADVESARREAKAAALQILSDEILTDEVARDEQIQVTREDGATVAIVSLWKVLGRLSKGVGDFEGEDS
jgi:hypothetical protein